MITEIVSVNGCFHLKSAKPKKALKHSEMFSERLVFDIREWRTPHPPISFPRPAILHSPRLSTIYTEIKPPARKRSCLFRIILQSVPLPLHPFLPPPGERICSAGPSYVY